MAGKEFMDAFATQRIAVNINGHQVVIGLGDYECSFDGDQAGGWVNLVVSVDGGGPVSICGGWLVAPGDASPYAPADTFLDWQVVPYGGYDNCGGGIGPDEERLVDALGYQGSDGEALLTMVADINVAAAPIFRAFREHARDNA